jgi:hypothetical protein
MEYPLNFYPVQEEIFKKREDGTGEWLLKSTLFTNWIAEQGQIL